MNQQLTPYKLDCELPGKSRDKLAFLAVCGEKTKAETVRLLIDKAYYQATLDKPSLTCYTTNN